jgi:hypothetical protein
MTVPGEDWWRIRRNARCFFVVAARRTVRFRAVRAISGGGRHAGAVGPEVNEPRRSVCFPPTAVTKGLEGLVRRWKA